MGSIQRRKGPNVVGILGFLQPFADGLKLVIKEIIVPNKSNKVLFLLAPGIVLFLSFVSWIAIPFDLYNQTLDLNYSLVYILVISALSVYGILLAGWSSNSKYALLGALRAIAQMLAYEVSISLCILPIIVFCSSLNMHKIIYTQTKTIWFIYPMFPLAIIFFISILAETNRAPFDLAEAEAELVAGYNVDYSSILFAAFFLGEYANILLMSSFFVCLYLGGSDISSTLIFSKHPLMLDCVFSIKVVLIASLFIFIRANLPRFRFDQLMSIGWKIFLPLTLSFTFFFCSLLFTSGGIEISQLPRLDKPSFVVFNSIRF
jgi:NADH:ubiquinone oxidoreductase subunit H